MLTPTRIYALPCLELAAACDVHAYAHITGGGLAANLARSLPPGCDAVLRRRSWTPPPIFSVLAERGRVPQAAMESTFNMGVGMATIMVSNDSDAAIRLLRARGVEAWVLGEVVSGSGTVRFV